MTTVTLFKRHRKMRVADLLSEGKAQLEALGTQEAQVSTERVLEELLGTERSSLYLNFDHTVPDNIVRIFQTQIQRRKARIPLAYLVGKAYFWEECLEVGPGCLIPRPETETLIQSVIDLLKEDRGKNFRFLDLGTGSGAIAVSLLRFFPKARATLVDISEEALYFARKNLDRYHLLDRSGLICADWLGSFESSGRNQERSLKWDFIVANPPYLSGEDFKHRQSEVRFEPRLALDGGPDGYAFYRRTIREAPFYLKEKGRLFMEAGRSQASQIARWLEAAGCYQSIRTVCDLAGIERVVSAQLKMHG